MRARGTDPRNERGAALILAILAMVIMTTVVIEFAYNTRVDVSMLSNYRSAQQGRYFAEVGVEAARVLLLSDLERDDADGRHADYYAYDASRATMQNQADPMAGAMGALAGAGGDDLMGAVAGMGGSLEEVWSLMNADMPSIPLGDTGAMIRLVIEDEQGKVNLNQFDVPRGFDLDSPLGRRWVNFFIGCGLDESEAAALIPVLLDWIDRNDEATTNGAESNYYEQLDPPYMARNGYLLGLGELRLVEGITGEVWQMIAPHVTVYPQENARGSKINVNTATKEALMFLDADLDESIAQAIIDDRNKEPFRADSEFRQVLQAYGSAELENRVVLAGVTLRSDVFSVRSAALVNDLEYTVNAVLERSRGSQQVKTLFWRAE